MSVIVAVAGSGGVIMGADMSSSNDREVDIDLIPKVWRLRGDAMVGVVGHGRLRDVVKMVPWPEGWSLPADIYGWLAGWIAAFRSTAIDAGVVGKGENRHDGVSGTILLTAGGHIFSIYSDFGVIEVDDHMAIGSGCEYALGNLVATRKFLDRPRVRVLAALEAAEMYAPTVRRPFTIIGPGDVD